MHMDNKEYRLILLFLLATVLSGCEKEKEFPDPDPVYLVESEFINHFSSNYIVKLTDMFSDLLPEFTGLTLYDISVYRIVYNTIDTDNNPVLASGALILPKTNTLLPLMSFQHITLTNETDAPSYFPLAGYITNIIHGSAGYIIALPDYLGYGSSKHLEPPYDHGHSLATASRDMLRATREFITLNAESRTDGKLFLTGYSQGGYATMALLKLLEEEHSDEFIVTAATMGAGAYNKSEFARQIIGSDEELTHLNRFLMVLDAYDRVYKINRPLNHYYNEPYVKQIEEDGILANTQLNPQILLTKSFREGIISGEDHEFIGALADNDNFDWKPETTLQLYHGDADVFVYYSNSASAYEAMTDRGASSVELITVPSGNHYSTFFDYFTGTFEFFRSF